MNLASASVIEPLCATLNELKTLEEIDRELLAVARDLFHGKGTRRDQREQMARDLNATRARIKSIIYTAAGTRL